MWEWFWNQCIEKTRQLLDGLLELDDNSHNQKDRQNRDAFVDQILTSVGYKVIRTHSITETTLESLIEPAPTQSET